MKKNKRIKLAAVLSVALLASALPATAFAESAVMPAVAEAGKPAPSGTAANGVDESAAKTAIDRAKAETLARQFISIPKEYTLQSTRLSSDWRVSGKHMMWGLEFVKRTNGKHVGSISVNIHADSGQLLAFSTYVNNPGAKPSYPLKVDRAAAGQVALSFIGEVAAPYKDQIALNVDYGVELLPPLTGQVVHNLRYDRVVNGIPYVDNYIELSIDSEGHVVSYHIMWDDAIKFPAAESRLSAAQADAKLRAEAKPQLSYILPYNTQEKIEPFLAYTLQPIAVDALTGELKVGNAYSRYNDPGNVSSTPVTAAPLGEKPKAGNRVTEAQALAAANEALKLPAGAELNSSDYTENYNAPDGQSSSSWHFSWSLKKDGKDNGSAYASVNASTGSVQSFNKYTYTESSSSTPAVSLDKASDLAADVVKEQLPWLTHELYLVKPDPEQFKNYNPGNYHFTFIHRVHGANVTYDQVYVGVNTQTGEITSFDASIYPAAYPEKAPAVISKDKAIDSWLTYYRTQLTYRTIQTYTWEGQPIPIEKYELMVASGEIRFEDVKSEVTADLVYRLVPRLIDENVGLDAQSGEWRNLETGDFTQLEKPKATDIDGHWAQRQLELMVAYKALDVKEGKVNPNATITRGELIKMLVLARNSGRLYGYSTMEAAGMQASFNDVAADSSYFQYVESALQENLIDLGDGSFNPEGKVSRDDMAELIVRALGYNALANYDGIFNTAFTDAVKVENKGQASIVVGLNIMSLSGGKFNPAKEVTRAEAASAFFRYLQTRAELQEAPIRM